MEAFGLAPLLLILPFLGFLFNALVGRRFVDANRTVGERWSGWVGSAAALASFGIAVLLFFSLLADDFHAHTVTIFTWINVESAGFNVPWAMQIDTLSVAMMLVVTGVGSLIHIYAIGYMHGDKDFSRFFAYLNLFLFFMLILVSGSSYLVLFVGWEGVGLCSFLLIGFWFDKNENGNAARKAFVANRVGDLAMILAMILTFWAFGSLEFEPVFEHALEMFEANEIVEFGLFEMTLGGALTAITALFLVGATGKSAQIPLLVWLPDAMAGPTPVSALIHAATMVTSGIYLIVRSNVLFEIVRESGATLFAGISSPDLVAIVGAVTALYAGLIAFTQNDVKKVLAYSTVSQLGFMVAAIGMGAYVAGMFHLITHAFFKALLFLGSGSIIHGMEHGHHHISHGHDHGHDDFDPQDMRTMGGLRHRMPRTFWTYLIGALALSGIPIFAGFWSKDEILLHAQANWGEVASAPFVYIVLSLAAVCTAFYMGRQLMMVFFGKARHEAATHAHESPSLMTVPLMVLAGLAIVGGFMNTPFFSEGMAEANGDHPAGAFLMLESWLEHSIEAFHLTEEGVLHLPHTPIVFSPMVAGLSTLLAVLSIGGAMYFVYRDRPQSAADPDPLQRTPIWWMSILPLNTLYMSVFVPAFNRLAYICGMVIDWQFWHDFVHERVIRGSFIALARVTNEVVDTQGVDGIVRGSGYFVSGAAGVIRRLQTGFVRNYALAVFLGVVAILAYFVLA